jgi:enoyl-CoA hydratase/carnithine racemase
MLTTATEARDALVGDPEGVGPLLVVDLDRGGPVHEVATAVAQLPCVAVGVATKPTAAPGFDVLLSTVDDGRPWCRAAGLDAAVAELGDAVTAHPQAAVTLVQVLRLGRERPLAEGLTVESLAYATLQAGAEHRAWLAGAPARRPAVSKEPVRLDRDGDTLAVTLDRPEVRNAVDAATRDALVAAFDLAAQAGLRVELRGAGPDFCSGGDLAEFGTTPDPATAHLVRATRSPARALAAVAGRTTVFLHGACIGAGIELGALAGRVVAAPATSIRLPELGMGLIPGAGGTATIPRRIGPERTAWLALTGAPLDAPTALAWDLVDVIEPDAK